MKNMKIPRITKLTELCGWDVPGADPKWYEEHQNQEMGGMTLA